MARLDFQERTLAVGLACQYPRAFQMIVPAIGVDLFGSGLARDDIAAKADSII
jgi:hypothetical protein